MGESHAAHAARFNPTIQRTDREHKSVIWPKAVQEKQESGGSRSTPAGSSAKQVLSDRERQRHSGRGTQMENNEILETQRSR